MDLETQNGQDADKDTLGLQQRIDLLEMRLNTLTVRAADVSVDIAPNTSPPLANPSPLGLLGFAIISWLSGVTKIVPGSADAVDGNLALAGIFVGGVAQLLAGLLHFAKNNAHSATTFSVYGLHWIVQGALIYERASGRLVRPSAAATATYYVMLAVTTMLLWLPSIRMNRVLNVTLLMVTAVFLLDAVAAFEVRGAEVAAGVLSCSAATMALYLCAADLVNETWRRVVLPVFPHEDHKDDYHRIAYIPRLHYHKSVTSSAHH